MLLIRPGTVSDAPALAAFAEAAFRHSHGFDATPANLEAYCAEHFGAVQQRAELAAEGTTFFLAMADNEVVGYLQLRIDHGPPCDISPVPQRFSEAKRVYVGATQKGTGLAARLMAECVSAASLAGSDFLWLSVWKHNHRAIAFYRKCGFDSACETTFALGDDVQEDWVMTRQL